MLKTLGIVIAMLALTIMLCAVFYSGWIFVTGSTYWLSQVLGAALIAITFLLGALCGSIIYTLTNN